MLARFVYGTRFAALDLVGGLLGAFILVTVGFALSRSATAVLGEVERVEKRLLGGAVVAAAVVLGFNALGHRLGAARPPA